VAWIHPLNKRVDGKKIRRETLLFQELPSGKHHRAKDRPGRHLIAFPALGRFFFGKALEWLESSQ
jgi:hypothetical protein